MRMNKTSRLLAVLLALLLALGSAPAALADGLVISSEQYAELSDAAVQEYYEELMACETYDALMAVIGDMSDAQFASFMDKLTDEQKAALDAHLEVTAPEYPMGETVDSFKAGPLKDAVTVQSTQRIMLLADTSSETTSGVYLNKTAEKVADQDAYKIRLEAYTTGTVSSTQVTKPVDIVLVLDQSGSMAYDFSGEEIENWNRNWTSSRQYALKVAVRNFIDAVAEKYDAKTSDHRISIVTFASGATVAQGWTAVDEDGATSLKNVIGAVSGDGASDSGLGKPSGGTYADDGMSTAKAQIIGDGYDTNVNNKERQKVVVFFTDGVPGSYGYTTSVADEAVDYAKDMKDAGVTVFSVGIFEGANASQLYGTTQYTRSNDRWVESSTTCDGTEGSWWGYNNSEYSLRTGDGYYLDNDYDAVYNSAANRFMNYVSSNYPTATSDGLDLYGGNSDNSRGGNESRGYFKITTNFTSGGSNYYLIASDADGLDKVFEAISNQINTETIDLGSETVLKDVVTPYFDLPANASDIKVYTADYKGTAFVNGAPVAADFEEDVAATGITVTPDPVNNTIQVTGFDYKTNCVTDKTKVDGSNDYGKKLVVEFTVTPDENFLGGNNVVTNVNTSAILDKDGNVVKAFPIPDVDVPVKTITPVVQDQNIYLTNDADLVALAGAKDSRLDGTNNDYVDAVYTITDAEDKVVATYTVEDGKTTGSWVAADGVDLTPADLVNDTNKYTITCTLTPTSTGTATSTTGTSEAKVNVFKPVLTFEDTVRDYMADVTGYDYDKQNLVSTKWMHGTTEADTTMGTAPTLTLTPDNEESTWITDNKVTGLNNVAVNMRVAIGGTDVTAYTTSYRNACNDSECKYAGGNGATAEFNPEFIVHIRNIYGALKVSKTVPAVTGDVAQPSADEFTFTVTFSDNKTYTYQKYNADGAIGEATSSNTFVLKNGEYVIFDKITANTTYTVVEAVNDDDYYTTNQSTITGTIVAATSADQKFTNEAAFTNTYTKLNDGNLTITKVVKDSTFTEGSKEFSFTVKLNSEDAVALKQFGEAMAAAGYTVANGEATVKITVNATDANKTKSLELNDLPVGSYTVTEAAVAGYNTTYDVQRVTVTEDGNVTVTVTNTATGIIDSIPVSKVWEDSNDTWKLRPTSVTAKLVGTKPDGTNYEHTLGTKMLSSANSWADAWTNVPMFDAEGNLITYTVDEEAVAGYTKSIEGNVITNTLNIGSLTIEKKNMQADESAIFDVEVTKGTETKVWTVVLNKNNNYTATLVGLPDGAEYEVSENEAWSWSYSLDAEKTTGAKGAIEAGEVKVASFENTKNEQWLYDESSAVNKFVGTNN